MPLCTLLAVFPLAPAQGQSGFTPSESSQPVIDLALGDAHAAAIRAGEAHRFRLQLSPGNYLVTLKQDGLDLTVELDSPRVVVNAPTLRDEQESVLLEIDRERERIVSVASFEQTDTTGRYEIAVDQLDDAAEISAYRSMTAAAVQLQADDMDSWTAAVRHYEDALQIWRSLGNEAEVARTLYSIGYVHYWFRESWELATAAAIEAAEHYGRLEQSVLQANAQQLEAIAAIEIVIAETEEPSDYSPAGVRQLLEDIRAKQAELSRPYDTAQTINYLGYLEISLSEYEAAAAHFEEAIARFRSLGEREGELNALSNLELINIETGQPALAVRNYRWLLENTDVSADQARYADLQHNLASALLVQGDTMEALRYYDAALQIHDRLDSEAGRARARAGLAYAYLSIGDFDSARRSFELSWNIVSQLDDGKTQLSVLRGLSLVARTMGDADAALDWQQIARSRAVSPLDQARVEHQRGIILLESERYEEAGQALLTARNHAQSIGSRGLLAEISHEEGRLYARRGVYDMALERLRDGRSDFRSVGSVIGQAKSELEIARVLRASEDFSATMESANRAVTQLETLRGRIADAELRAIYLSTRRQYYDFLVETLMERYLAQPSGRDARATLHQALEASERARARATVDLVHESAVDVRGAADSNLIAERAALFDRLIDAQYRRDALINGVSAPELVEASVAELQDARTRISIVESEIRASNPSFQDLKAPVVLSAASMQSQLEGDSVLLQYFLADDFSYLWIVTRDDIEGVRLPRRAQLDDLAKRLHELLSVEGNRGSRVEISEIATQLATTVVAPAADWLQGKTRLIVSADGGLQYVPFIVLLRALNDNVDSVRELISVPSLSTVANHRSVFAERDTPPMTLAAFGDPIFGASDARLRTGGDERARAAAAEDARTGRLRQRQLPRLIFSGEETSAISALVSTDQRLVRLGAEARKEAILADGLADYRYVHFATHGLVDSAQPSLSRLVFSRFDQAGRPLDGDLNLHDIYNLRLGSDLVVLSACETALGRDIRGEGLVGLTQAFLYAGAKSVAASLWKVDDRPTKELMVRFYGNLLQKNQSPPAAMMNAQEELASDRRWAHPHHWAGFVLQGDWQSD